MSSLKRESISEEQLDTLIETQIVKFDNPNVTGKQLTGIWDVLKKWYPLIGGKPGGVYYRLAETFREVPAHPAFPVSTMREVILTSNHYAVVGVARNPNCPVSILKNLRNHEMVHIRSHVVRNRNCPIELLDFFPNDPVGTQIWVAENDLPVEVFERIADLDANYSPEVYLFLIGNAFIPVGIAVSLFEGLWLRQEDLREHMFTTTPDRVLFHFLEDKYPEVRVGMLREWLVGLCRAELESNC